MRRARSSTALANRVFPVPESPSTTATAASRVFCHEARLASISASLGSQTAQRDLVAEHVLSLRVTTQAMVKSFENGFRWTAFSIALGLILILLVKRPKAAGAVAGAH